MAKETRKEILIVNDSYNTRMLLATTFEAKGYVVSQATDGQNALDIIDKKLPHCFDAIITDYEMPVMNGKEFVDRLRSSEYSKYNNIKIIMCSGGTMHENEDLGTNYFLPKPCGIKKILECVELPIQDTIEEFDVQLQGEG